MAPHDVEKAGDLDSTESTANSEKIEPGLLAEGAYGEPDSDHEEVEQMDAGPLGRSSKTTGQFELSGQNPLLISVRLWHRLMLVP